ncbi:MAG: hypothetical protein SFV32_10800 [Opitutaceae bacterium]|nr:hypothetical protein [Opitutaceae bacterium]
MQNENGNGVTVNQLPRPEPLLGSSRLGRFAIIASVLFVLFFQLWSLRTSTAIWERPYDGLNDYYNLLSRGLLAGELSLAIEPDPRLVALENPYPPENRKGMHVLHDASFYKGKYYLYWGPAPAVVLFAPFRALTGKDLPPMYANVLFTWLGFLSVGYLFLRIRRDFFPRSSDLIAALGLVALGCGGFTLALLRRSSVWELPIAAGHGFAMLGLAFAYLGLVRGETRRWWLLSSAALGLAMASRPTYSPGIAIVMVCLFVGHVLLKGFGRPQWKPQARWLVDGLSFAAPCFLCFLTLLWYNLARFDHPLEFGLKYQMSGANEMASTHFTFRYAAHNFYLYYLAPAQWGRYFPFVQLIPSPAEQPEGYYGMEYTYGILANLPLTWLALVLPFGILAVERRHRLSFGIVLVALAGFFAAVAITLLGFWAATQRYMADFTPSLILLSLLGVLICEHFSEKLGSRWAKFSRGMLGAMAAAAAAFGMCVSFQLHGLFRHYSPGTYETLARICNYPAYAVERIAGFKHGPVVLTLKFPQDKQGRFEPILMTGWEFYSDQLFVHYIDSKHIQFGFDHLSRGTKITPAIEIDYQKEHVLLVEMGSLYPPDAHPFFTGVSETSRSEVRNTLRLVFNGVVIHDSLQQFYDAAPESLRIGSTCYPKAYGTRFSGEVVQVQRRGVQFAREVPEDGEVLAFQISVAGNRPGIAEPLVSLGNSFDSDTFYLRHVGEGLIRFGYNHDGVSQWEGPIIPVNYSQPLDMEVTMPGLVSGLEEGSGSTLGGRLVVRVNQRVIWLGQVAFFPSANSGVVTGRAINNSKDFPSDFLGAIGKVSSLRKSSGGVRNSNSLAVALLFQPAVGKREPLVVWGRTGAADILFVEFLADNKLRLGVDHWGVGVTQSPEISYNPAEVQTLDISRKASSVPGERLFELTMNGVPSWTFTGKFHETDEKDLDIAINRIGASTCSDTFSGTVVYVEYR